MSAKQGKWKIKRMNGYPQNIRWKSWIVHECGYVSWTDAYGLASVDNKCCIVCNAPIPKDVFEAWRAQNSHMKSCR